MSTTQLRGREEEALEQLQQDPWYKIGRSTAAAFAERKEWLYRRVETLEFTGARTVRRHLSVDFEIPKELPLLEERGAPGAMLIPISVFRKWPPLMDFDLRGPEEHPTSLYVRDTNKALDFGLLIGTIEDATKSARIPDVSDELRRELAVLVASDHPNQLGLETVVGTLADHLSPGPVGNRDESVEEKVAMAIDLAGQLGGNSILWVTITGEPGTDQIVKFSYLDDFEPPGAWWKRLLIACSWRERTINVLLPHAGRSARYHLDMEVPGEGLELMSLQTIGYPSVFEAFLTAEAAQALTTTPQAPSNVSAVRTSAPSPSTAVSDARRPEGESAIVERRGHVYLAYDPRRSHRIIAEARIAPTRSGFVQSCLVAALAIAALTSATFANLGAATRSLDPTIVLLAAVPVVLGYLLVRPNSHAIERDHIVGVRTLMLLSGAVPILGALALVLSPRSLLEPIWAGLLITSWYLVAALGASWVFAAPRSEDTRKHRWLRIVPASGILGGLALLAGTILCCQPYSHIAPSALHNYIREDRAFVLGGSLLVGVGLAALYTLIGGIWRTVAVRRSTNKRSRRVGWALVVGGGVIFVWTIILVLTLECWQALRLTHGVRLHHHHLVAFMRALDVVENVALVPLLVFILSSSVYLILTTRTVRGTPTIRGMSELSPVGPRASQGEPEVEGWVVAVGMLIGVTLIVLRGASLLWRSDGHVAARVAWVGFAIWVLAIACALRYRITFSRGRLQLERHVGRTVRE